MSIVFRHCDVNLEGDVLLTEIAYPFQCIFKRAVELPELVMDVASGTVKAYRDTLDSALLYSEISRKNLWHHS